MADLRPPYTVIYEKLSQGRVIPFLGAGVPLYMRNPTTDPWLMGLAGKLTMKHLPTARELARELKRLADLDDSGDELIRTAQYYELALGADPLRERLRDIFSYAQPPTPVHEFLAGIEEPLLIVTTNYDDLMERAFAAAKKPYDVVVHLTDKPSVLWWEHGRADPREVMADELLVDLDDVAVVYKMHGAIDRRPDTKGSYVITENDYIEFLTRMTRNSVIPSIFAKPFKTRPFLFLGYGLYDWNLRVLLNSIQTFRAAPAQKSWAIETLAKPVEKALWAARGLNVYDELTLQEFLEGLKDAAGASGAGAGGGGS